MSAISVHKVLVGSPAFARWARIGWLLFFTIVVCLYVLRQISDGPYGKDFTIFLTGGQIVGEGNVAQLYDLGVQAGTQKLFAGSYTFPGGVLPFNYPPFVAYVFSPLVKLTAPIAYYLWVAAQLGLLVCMAFWFARSYTSWRVESNAPSLLVLAVLCFQPALEAVLMGQMSIITVALWWWALWSWRHEKWDYLGVAIALSAFKPQMTALLVVALVAQRRWRALIAMLIATGLLWLGGLLAGGPGVLIGYVQMLLTSASSIGTLGFYPAAMPNLRGLLTLVGLPDTLVTAAAMLAWVASLAATYVLWRRRLPLVTKFGLTAVLAVVFSPHLYMHDASLLLVGFVCALIAAGPIPASQRLNRLLLPFAAIALSIYGLIMGVTGSYVPVILSLLLLGGVLAWMLAGRTAAEPSSTA